jgi:serine/threonine-protein kinase
VDERADVWAFGICLFEALTGKRVFEGDNPSLVLASVLKDEPPWASLPGNVPPGIRRLLRRCLAKSRKERLRSIGDARLDLLEPAGASASQVIPPAGRTSSLIRWMASLGILGLAIGFVTLAALWRGGAGSDGATGEVLRIPVGLPDGVDIPYFWEPYLAISPDGTKIAYRGRRAGKRELYLENLTDDLPPVLVPASEQASAPFFSPDGRSLGFATDRLTTVPLEGGDPRFLAPMKENVHGGGAWGPDGTIWFVEGNTAGIKAIDPDGAVVSIHEPPANWHDYGSLQPLPGGRHLLCAAFDGSISTILAVDTATGEQTPLFQGGFSPRYVPTGHLLVAQRNVLLAMTFDTDNLAVGPAIPVLEGLVTIAGTDVAGYAVSDSGALAFVSGALEEDTWLVRIRPGEQPQRLHETPFSIKPSAKVRVSRDGKWALLQSLEQDLFLFDLERGRLGERATATVYPEFHQIWSPDGHSIAYGTAKGGEQAIVLQSVRETEEERTLLSGPLPSSPGSISPDGRTLAFFQQTPDTQADLWMAPLEGDGEARVFLRTPFDEWDPVFSPDGRQLAYISDEAGQWEVWVTAYPDRSSTIRVSDSGGVGPKWGPDGRQIFYSKGGQVLVADFDAAAFETSPPRLFVDGIDRSESGFAWDITPDGKSVIAVEARPPQKLHLVLNWFEELDRLVPTG